MSSRHRRCNRKWNGLQSCTSHGDPAVVRPTPPVIPTWEVNDTVFPPSHVDDFSDSCVDGDDQTSPHPSDPTVSTTSTVGKISKPELSRDQMAMLDIMLLLDNNGANRGVYNELMTLLRKHCKRGFNPINANNREKFLEDMRQKVHVPAPIRSTVRGRTVFRFPLQEMIQDLLLSHHFDSIDKVLLRRDDDGRLLKFEPRVETELSEVMSRRWAQDTFDQICDYDPSNDLFLPLILYADKTGTDRYQRYPLEPWMFTFALFPRQVREKADAWRHVGFIPPTEDIAASSDDQEDQSNEQWMKKSQQSLQLYHDYLAELLTDLKVFSSHKPEMLVNFGGITERRRLHISVAIIVGDQKSQDYVCGRISSNKGAAGRVHRACMCSGPRAGDAKESSCSSLVNADVISELNRIGLLSSESLCSIIRDSLPGRDSTVVKQRNIMIGQVTRTIRLARALLAKPYTLHPLRNAFDGVSFGANTRGVHTATAEDHLHSTEAGVIKYLNDVMYGLFTDKESADFEDNIRSLFCCIRSSASQSFPTLKLKKNFTSQSLMTHTEKVGSLLNFRLSMELPQCRDIWEKSSDRHKLKYKKFPNVKSTVSDHKSGSKRKRCTKVSDKNTELSTNNASAKDFPLRKDLLFAADRNKDDPFPRNDLSLSFLFRHLWRHGFEALFQEDALDELQVEQFTTEAWDLLRPLQSKSPRDCYPLPEFVEKVNCSTVRHLLRNSQNEANEPSCLERNCNKRLRRFKSSYVVGKMDASLPIAQVCQPLNYNHTVPVPNCVRKHLRKKPKVDGSGFTGAILCKSDTFVTFVEYLLCYHAWCHYSYLLPKLSQADYDTVDFGSMVVVQYFDTFVYRGDTSTDSDTCKMHSQLHVKRMIDYFGDLMQYNSGTGERGLKDWAKGASRTARKRGIEAFTEDTTKRVCEAILLKHLSESVLGDLSNNESSRDTAHGSDSGDFTLDGKRCHAMFTRNCPHFKFCRDNVDSVVYLDIQRIRRGVPTEPSQATGTISTEIVDALMFLEPEQDTFEVWCEAITNNGSHVRCFPNYHGNTGPWYDWVMVKFSVTGRDRGEDYPCKLLAFYKDGGGCQKAIVHSVRSKTTSSCEGPFKDSRLITHYRKEFDVRGHPVLRSINIEDIQCCLVAREAKPSNISPLPERTVTPSEQREHTVFVLRPREEWASLFVDWTREIKRRRTDVSGNEKYRLI